MSPVLAPFSTLHDAAAFPLGPMGSGRQSTLATLVYSSSNGLLSAILAIRLVKEEAEEPLGLVTLSSGHSR